MKYKCNCFVRTQPVDWDEQSQRLVRRFKNKRVSCPDDLAQATLGRALSKCCLFDPTRSTHATLDNQVGAWLGGFANHVLLEYFRKEREKQNLLVQYSEVLLQKNEDQSNRPIDVVAISSAFASAVQDLTTTDQITIRLRHLDWSVEAIALEKGISIDAVYQRLHRFRVSLKAKLDQAAASGDYLHCVSNRTMAYELHARLLSHLYHSDCRRPGDLGSESFVRWVESSTKLPRPMKQRLTTARTTIERFPKSVEDKEYACGLLTEWVVYLERGKTDERTSSGYRKLLLEVVGELEGTLQVLEQD